MGYEFNQSLNQELSLSQVQLFSLQLLSMDGYELEQYLIQSQLENPFVEIINNHDCSVLEKEYDEHQWKNKKSNEEYTSWETYTASKEPFDYYRFFFEQISVSLTTKEASILRYLTSIMDETGFVPFSDRQVANAIPCSEKEVHAIRTLLQELEPHGCGSENMVECVCFQLYKMHVEKSLIELCNEVLKNHLNDYSKGQYQKIAKSTNASKSEILQLKSLIEKTNPIPLNGFGGYTDGYIVPDIIVENDEGEWIIRMNQTYMNSISVSKVYDDLARNSKNELLQEYCKQHRQSARVLKRSLEQRKDTMMKIAMILVKTQNNFILGNGPLKPMQMKDLASELDMHESTISRAIKNKYVQIPRGVFPLRMFFESRSIKNDEDGVSVSLIKEQIKEIIDHEDKTHPYSDQAISELMSAKGLDISRRTVTKHRESMQIGSTRLRKLR